MREGPAFVPPHICVINFLAAIQRRRREQSHPSSIGHVSKPSSLTKMSTVRSSSPVAGRKSGAGLGVHGPERPTLCKLALV